MIVYSTNCVTRMKMILNAFFSTLKFGGYLKVTNCIARFDALYESVDEFLQQFYSALANAITSAKHDVAHLWDFFEKMNEMSLKLQSY